MAGLFRFLWMLAGLTLSLSPLFANARYSPAKAGDVICYLPLPPGISSTQLRPGNNRLISQLHQYARTRLENPYSGSETAGHDRVILFTDAAGNVIRPEANQVPAARINGFDLQFTFNSPAQPWTAAQLASFATWISDIYPAIKQLLGSPFFNSAVNVRRDSTLTVSGYFYPALNEIVLRTPTAQSFCHETIHAFRDDYVMALSAFEEGLTRAAEVEVFGRLTAYTHPSDEFHSYEYDQYYDALNKKAIGCFNGNLAANITLTAMKYNLASYAWGKAQIEDTSFLRRFNDSLYDHAAVNLATLASPTMLAAMAANLKPLVEGWPFQLWYSRQQILNVSPPSGYQLFQRVNQFYLDYFYRDMYGAEAPQSGSMLNWQALDYANNVLASGTGATAAVFGWVDCGISLPGYTGRLKLIANVQSPQGLISDTAIRAYQPGASGVFGVVEDANTGTVSVTPLDTALATQTATLQNGAFSLPALKNVRGRFRVDYYFSDCGHVSRIFTKDRSSYFISIRKEPVSYWTGAVDDSWHNPLNWTGGAIPDDCTDAVIMAGVLHPCVVNTPASCRTLTIQAGAVITANSDLTITKP